MGKKLLTTLRHTATIGARAKVTFLVIGLLAVGLVTVINSQAIFQDSHTLYTNKTSVEYGVAEMCLKCHPEQVSSTMISAHADAGCICHGYNPSAIPTKSVNLAHNMTKQIYCTNCHSNYDSNGNITIYSGVSGLNQSGHYITNDTAVLYNNSRYILNQV
ncbi:MAG: hypothetical protein Q7J10_02815 [Methanosarcinaceae archaeon]|nr:hypothetical protein [Methanosarcinaceae archaeon]